MTTDPRLAIAIRRAELAGRWLALAHFRLAAGDGDNAEWFLGRADYVLAVPHRLLPDVAPQVEELLVEFETHEAGVDCAGTA